MPRVMITNANSEESPLCDFGISVGDIFTVEVQHRDDGKWEWVVKNWREGVSLEIMPDECQLIGENIKPIRSHA